jgi:hypothetical protein
MFKASLLALNKHKTLYEVLIKDNKNQRLNFNSKPSFLIHKKVSLLNFRHQRPSNSKGIALAMNLWVL